MLTSTIEFGKTEHVDSWWTFFKSLPFRFLEVWTRSVPSFFGLCSPKPFEIPEIFPPSLSPERSNFLAPHFGTTTPSQKQLLLLNIFLTYHEFFSGAKIPKTSFTRFKVEDGPDLGYPPEISEDRQLENLNEFVEFLKNSSSLENVMISIHTEFLISHCFGPVIKGRAEVKESWKAQKFPKGRWGFTTEKQAHSTTAFPYISSIRANRQYEMVAKGLQQLTDVERLKRRMEKDPEFVSKQMNLL